MLTIALINSSVQKRNYTAFVLNIVKNELVNQKFKIIEINLKDFTLPFPGEEIENDNSDKLRNLLKSADAYIVGCPEYNGSFTAKLKLMIENSGFPSMMKGKPVGLVGLASGILGATKSLEQLRTVFSHIGGFVLPRVVSIAEVEKQFDEEGNCISAKTEKDIRLAAVNMASHLSLIKSQ
jgi:NAD(P)H-dependent FMN reductase